MRCCNTSHPHACFREEHPHSWRIFDRSFRRAAAFCLALAPGAPCRCDHRPCTAANKTCGCFASLPGTAHCSIRSDGSDPACRKHHGLLSLRPLARCKSLVVRSRADCPAKLVMTLGQRPVTASAAGPLDQHSCVNGPFRLPFIPTRPRCPNGAESLLQHFSRHRIGAHPAPALATQIRTDASPQRPLQPKHRSDDACVECHPDRHAQLFHQQVKSPGTKDPAPRIAFLPRQPSPACLSVSEVCMLHLHPITASSSAALIGCFETGGRVFTPSGALEDA